MIFVQPKRTILNSDEVTTDNKAWIRYGLNKPSRLFQKNTNSDANITSPR